MAETVRERRARLSREKAERETRNTEAATRAKEAEARRVAAEANARVEAARIEAEREQRRATERRENAARAERERIRLAAEAATTKAAAEAKRKAEAAMPWQIGTSLAALPAGMAVGAVAAKIIDKRHQAARAVANKELGALGKQAATLLDKVPVKGKIGRALAARLSGVVVAADKLGLGKVRGPIGLVPAALLLSEAALVRFGIAPQIQDERARAVVGGVATASVFAATNLIGERMVQNATVKALPSATALAAVEAARKLVPAAVKTSRIAAVAGSVASVAAPLAGRVLSRALPVAVVAMAAWEGYQGYRKEGVTGAAIGIADSLTFGAVSAGRAYLNSGAEKRAAIVPSAPAIASSPLAGSPVGTGNGGMKSYTTVDGRTVQGTAAQVAAWDKQKGR